MGKSPRVMRSVTKRLSVVMRKSPCYAVQRGPQCCDSPSMQISVKLQWTPGSWARRRGAGMALLVDLGVKCGALRLGNQRIPIGQGFDLGYGIPGYGNAW